ncbi:unnamed protein product [Hapterophycus canaliculatus]
MTIYGIGGVSGTGKTHFRTTCEGLRQARTLDIADVYEESLAQGRPDLHWRTALEIFEARVRGRLEEDRVSDIVVEAFFRPDGTQRHTIEALAREFGVDVRWGWASAPRAECLRRVSNERNQDSSERREKRLSFIRSAEPAFFEERREESLASLANHSNAKLFGAPVYES